MRLFLRGCMQALRAFQSYERTRLHRKLSTKHSRLSVRSFCRSCTTTDCSLILVLSKLFHVLYSIIQLSYSLAHSRLYLIRKLFVLPINNVVVDLMKLVQLFACSAPILLCVYCLLLGLFDRYIELVVREPMLQASRGTPWRGSFHSHTSSFAVPYLWSH